MSLLSLRKKSRPEAAQDPAPAAVQAAAAAADLPEPRGRHHAPAVPGPNAAAFEGLAARQAPAVAFEGASGTGLMPASQAPSGDETIVFRAPDASGVPGYAVPPGTPWMTHPDGAFPRRTPGAGLPSWVRVPRTGPADPVLLHRVAGGLRALPDGPEGQPAPSPNPAAWLRAVQPEGFPHLDAALAGRPRFIRAVPSRHGQFAEVHLGETDDGPYRIAADREWLKAAGLAFLQAADAAPAEDTRSDIPAVPAAGGAR